jgi:uncharacterized protein YdcH (DUF465 family)
MRTLFEIGDDLDSVQDQIADNRICGDEGEIKRLLAEQQRLKDEFDKVYYESVYKTLGRF